MGWLGQLFANVVGTCLETFLRLVAEIMRPQEKFHSLL